ncbi:acyltransferase [Neisseria sp. 83E34]|nr:lysophospholipid acyltransferase family protein [Neisseria sp. 83E34]KPN71888.1 acyltransferase [Neisseria sp. 83E34]
MMNLITRQLAWITDQALCLFVSFLTGVRPKSSRELNFSQQQKVYYANHGSHGDFVLVWISLPRRWRMNTRPVAGEDYWLGSRFKRFMIQNVFNALLIPRNSDNPQAVTEQMSRALHSGDSLIIFPEGTRNTDDNTVLLPFKTGIYHLAKAKPDTEFVPLWINNISRVLPKGKILPVPLLCDVNIGSPLRLENGEDKQAFLDRTRNALLALAPKNVQEAAVKCREKGENV